MTIVIIWGNKLTMIKEAPPAVYVNQGMIFYQLKRSKYRDERQNHTSQ